MSLLSASQTEPPSTSEAVSELPFPMPSRPLLEMDERTGLLLMGGSSSNDNNNNNNNNNSNNNAQGVDHLKALNMVIRQDPFSMTLDANALLAGSLFLLMGMHFVPRLLLESCILAVPLLFLIRNDYQNFLRLGPGGTPPTLAGYARLAWFRLFALRDPFSPPPRRVAATTTISRPAAGVLTPQNLPYRSGPRPTVAGLAPQRQLNQHGSPTTIASLRAALTRLAKLHPSRFGTATSCIEKHGFALFARHPVSEHVCGNGEVCHIHSSDRSMHMNLHPDDIAEVLAKGWAERHPLAFGAHRKWWEPRSPLPETFVLVYSPRDESDLRVVCKIIEAAIWYTVEERVDIESLLMVQPPS